MTVFGDRFVAVADRMMTRFKSGSLATVQRKTEVSDGMGGFTTTWANLYVSIECAVIPMSGDEIEEAARLNYKATHNVLMRYVDVPGIKSDDLILFDGRTFAIRDPRNVAEANAIFKIRCEEGVAV